MNCKVNHQHVIQKIAFSGNHLFRNYDSYRFVESFQLDDEHRINKRFQKNLPRAYNTEWMCLYSDQSKDYRWMKSLLIEERKRSKHASLVIKTTLFKYVLNFRLLNGCGAVRRCGAAALSHRKEIRGKPQMGAAASTHDPRHVRIWANLEGLSNPAHKLQMLQTLLEGQEYVNAAKRAGIYADLLGWVRAQRSGEYFPWPRPYAPAAAAPIHKPPTLTTFLPPPSVTKAPATFAPPPQRTAAIPPQNYTTLPSQRTTAAATATPSQKTNALARIPPPKRALDVLNESYMLLEIDDSQPLTHEVLRRAYKKAAVKAHPDKGGSAAQFDQINRAYGYLEEILNKLLPKTASEGGDPRFTMVVNPETAAKQRGDYIPGSTPSAPGDALRIEDAPMIALNPKKLDMALFNKLFEENKLPDPDAEGYGDWLKSSDGRNDMAVGGGSTDFKQGFVNRVKAATGSKSQDSLSKYKPPSDLVLSPGFGTLIGAQSDQYTKATGSMLDGHGLAYTDLKHAYGDGATFSQELDGDLIAMPIAAPLPGRAQSYKEAEREYGSAPKSMSAEESAAVAAFERAREHAEQQRRARAAARDVDAEAVHNRLKGRLMIRE